MTATEDLVRSTTRALAGTVRAVRRLPPLPQAAALDEISRARFRGWLRPAAAAASVVVIALAAMIIAHLASPSGTHGATATTGPAPRPEFYMTAMYPPSGPNVLRLQVRRTAGGAVTASTTIPAANMGWGNNITATASGRVFFVGHYPCSSTVAAVTTFYRITITGSGRISGMTTAGHVPGMLTYLAVSPDGSRMAYSALPGTCGAGAGLRSSAAGAVSILSLSTGAVRTWPDTTGKNTTVDQLSWAPDGRTLVVDELSRLATASRLTVFGLDTATSGGSLRAHGRVLLQQTLTETSSCTGSPCVSAALAGPDGSLTALEFQAVGKQTRALVVSIPLAAGSRRTVLYSELSGRTNAIIVGNTSLYADPSGRWVLLWPAMAASPGHYVGGWIGGGRLHPLPGLGEVFPQAIAW